jgi:hypothetical protein
VLGLQPGKAHAGLTLPARKAGLILCFTSFAVPHRGGLGTSKALEGWSVFSGSSPLVARRWLTLPKKAAQSDFIF